MKLKVNDTVIVITGKDKGKTGKIIKVLKKSGKVVVEKLNIRTKHIKKSHAGPGSIVKFEAPMDASNVMLLDPKEKKPTRIGYIKEDGKKKRVAKLSKTILDDSVEYIEEKQEKEKKEEKKEKTTKKSKIKTIKA